MTVAFPGRFAAILLVLFCAVNGFGEPVRTQTIQLRQGWNAVFLEITPKDTTPEKAISSLPVDIIASYFPVDTPVQFISNPGTAGWKKESWGVWYAPGRPDSFLSTLFEILGHRAYLVRAQRDCTWTVEGYGSVEVVPWQSDSFNFVGFSLDSQSPPTFEKFFGGSKAHRDQRIYRLVADRWTLVTAPAATLMNPGEAFWIYCKGTSDYQGPLGVRLPTNQGIIFGETGTARAVLSNFSSDPMDISIETVASDAGLPLSFVIRTLNTSQIRDVSLPLGERLRLTSLEPNQQVALILEVRREKMVQEVQSALLRLKADNGACVWVPVIARRADLANSP